MHHQFNSCDDWDKVRFPTWVSNQSRSISRFWHQCPAPTDVYYDCIIAYVVTIHELPLAKDAVNSEDFLCHHLLLRAARGEDCWVRRSARASHTDSHVHEISVLCGDILVFVCLERAACKQADLSNPSKNFKGRHSDTLGRRRRLLLWPLLGHPTSWIEAASYIGQNDSVGF